MPTNADEWPVLGGVDPDEITRCYAFEEPYNVGVAHFDTAATKRSPDAVLVVGPMNIDVARIGVASGAVIDAGHEAFQAEDAGGNEVLFARIRLKFGKMSCHWHTPAKDATGRTVAADFIGDCVQAKRRAKRICLTGGRVAGGGNIKNSALGSSLEKGHALVLNGDHQVSVGGLD